jgi:5'-phosphate synthase pdxT subunit
MAVAVTVGVLALQGAFIEHINLLQHAADALLQDSTALDESSSLHFDFIEVRTPLELAKCHALIIPGGESTAISLIAERTGLLEPLREFVKVQRLSVWGTCAGLILLAESADRTKSTGQELIGGLDVRVQRNYFGRQVESFEAELDLPFLGDIRDADGASDKFHSVFIRAPVVQNILSPSSGSLTDGSLPDTVYAPPKQETTAPVEILARLPGRAKALNDSTLTAEQLGEEGDIVAVRQGNVFATAFHPELTGDARIHEWWLRRVVDAVSAKPPS